MQWLEAAMLAERMASPDTDRLRRDAMPTKRLFVDMPKSLHRRFKAAAPGQADHRIALLDQPSAEWRPAFRAAVDQRRLGAGFL